MLPKGKKGRGVAATFMQILKTFVRIGDIVLDKSAPTPSSSTGTLGTQTVKLSCQRTI